MYDDSITLLFVTRTAQLRTARLLALNANGSHVTARSIQIVAILFFKLWCDRASKENENKKQQMFLVFQPSTLCISITTSPPARGCVFN